MTELRKLYVYDETSGRPINIDDATDSIVVVEHEHSEIHGGDHYFVMAYEDLSINEVIQFTFQMPNTTKWIHWSWSLATESELLWQVYEGGSITNALANAVTPLNSDRNSSNTSDTTMRYEVHADLAAANTDVTPTTLIQAGVSGSGKGDGGEAGLSQEIVLKQGELYVLRGTANAAGNVSFIMEWYEDTNAS